MTRVLVDFTPATGQHGIRGIGTYVRGLASTVSEDAELAAAVVAMAASPIAGAAVVRPPWWLDLRSQDIGPLTGLVAQSLALRPARASTLHQTDPRRPMRPFGARRLAVTAYDLIPLDLHHAGSERWHRQWIYAAFVRSLRGADRVIAISRTTAVTVAERLDVPIDRIDVVPPVVQGPLDFARTATSEPTFLFVGVPDEHKRPELALCALATYRARYGSGLLRFIGPMAPRHSILLAEISRRLKIGRSVEFSGVVPAVELEAAWSSAAGLLALSRVEGFGLPPVEAAIRGVPVIAVDTPIARETLGNLATYVAPDPASIAEGMHAAVPASRDDRAALAERYSPARVAIALRAAYSRLVDG
jgi:glycosyltransferase involved in cell wall biosynthesis